MTVRRFLDLSTAHLMPETRNKLDNQPPTVCYPHPEGFGWLVWVPTDLGTYPEYPEDLVACFNRARELECDYVLFDSDAEEVDELPTYDDDYSPSQAKESTDGTQAQACDA